MTFEQMLLWVGVACVIALALAVVYFLENPDK